MSNKLTPEYIQSLMQRVVVNTTLEYVPTAHVTAIAWLDGKFYLGTAISKSVDPLNFDAELGREYSTADVLKIAEQRLWELEGYKLYTKLLEDQV